MNLQKINIDKNIAFSSIHTDKFKTGMLTVSIYSPLDARDYLLSLVLAGVMRRGNERYPSMAHINRRLDELYASSVDIQSVIHGDVISFCISADMLESRFAIDGTDISAEVADVMAQILLSPLTENGIFPAASVEKEKNFIKDSLSSEKSNTRLYASTRLKELMSRGDGERFPRLEYMLGSIDSISAEELWRYYVRLISQAPLNVFYVGAENAELISKKILRAFKKYIGTSLLAPSAKKAYQSREFLSLTEDMPVNQGKLALGFTTNATLGSGRDAAAIVFNEIFGASPASKLFLNVRERCGLCYYCSSSYSILSGTVTVSSGINVKNRDRATEEILSQLEEIRKGNISDAELFAARRSLEYSYVQIYDSPFSLQAFYTVRDVAGFYETVEECKARILSVTPEEISQIAKSAVYDTCFFLNGTLNSEETEDGFDE